MTAKIEQRPWMMPFKLEGSEEYILPSRGLKLIGIRFYAPSGSHADELKAKYIQKSLYGRQDWFYFNKGFKVVEGKESIDEVLVDESAFDSSFLLYTAPEKSFISVSAIVGQNGTGKSTIVDTIIRLLNNLSAAINGEGYVYTSAQHLHYIDHVYASLAIYQDSKIYILTCLGRYLEVTPFEVNLKKLSGEYNNDGSHVVEHYIAGTPNVVLFGNEDPKEILPPQEQHRHILKEWFYTLVSNYSLYAYNYRDYIHEKTNDERIDKFRQIRPQDNKPEDEFWLKGVFHKNDGYQTPIVIHPMREDGSIRANKVNYLGKQNLISLCFERREVVLEDGSVDRYAFPFRVINQTHHIVAFYFYPDEDKAAYRGFVEDGLNKYFDLDEITVNKLAVLEKPIREFWENAAGITYNQQKDNNKEQQAWTYLICKTIKVLWTYSHYKTIWDKVEKEYDEETFKKDLGELLRDYSHRTQKLRRTVCYLRFCDDAEYYLNKGLEVSVDDIYAWMITKIGEYIYPKVELHKIDTEDLLPPPVVNVVLQLVDNEHLESYVAGSNNNEIIPFEGLSSGERQIAYTIGNIIYHLKNIESGKQVANYNSDQLASYTYNYANILLDEVELYFHPDLQRRFINLLVDSIRGLNMPSNSGVNITVVTHSPFVLSDIPRENILFMSRSDEEYYDRTFAANIHDLFNNTFILPYTIGEYAQRVISEIISYYHYIKSVRSSANGWKRIDNMKPEYHERRMAMAKYVSSVIGDDYIRDEVADMVDEINEWFNSEDKNHEED